MNKRILLPVTAVAIFLVGWLVLSGGGEEASYSLVTPKQGEFRVTVSTSGELRAKNAVSVMGPSNAWEAGLYRLTIQDMIPEGTVVSEGDYVAELDRTDLHTEIQEKELELQQAVTELEQARLDTSLTLSQARNALQNIRYEMEEAALEVEQSIYESPAVQRQAEIALERAGMELEQEEKNYQLTQLQSAASLREIEAELASVEIELQRILALDEQFTIYAPQDGMLIYYRDRRGNRQGIGAQINARESIIAELPDFSSMESVAYANEVDVESVRPGQFVNVGLDVDRNRKLTGEITQVANIGEQRRNSDAKVFEVIIEISESDSTLRPTMTTSNEIIVESIADAVYLPLEAIHLVDNSHFVYKEVDEDEVVLQQVALGAMSDREVVIKHGVTPLDQVVVSMPPGPDGLERILLPDDQLEEETPPDLNL